VAGASVTAESQRAAVLSEFRRRRLFLPGTFDVPDRKLWTAGYAAEARRSLLPACRTLDEALACVCRFTDPILTGTASGTWDPELQAWR
jgi:hypothetical protein